MSFINRLFDPISMNAAYGYSYATILMLSIVSAVLFMIIFKKASDQKAIEREKGKIVGYLFQIRLYKDSLFLILSSIFHVFKHNLLYVRHTLRPLVIIIIPLLLITVQINQRCGYTPLQPGDDFIVSAKVADAKILEGITCRATPGIALMTPVLRIPDQRRAFWRAKVRENAGANEEIVLYASNRVLGRKNVAAIEMPERFSPKTVRARGLEAVLYNAEGFLPDHAKLEQISIDYSRSTYSFLGFPVDAVVLYFIWTLIFALIVKPFFRVVI